MRQLLTKIFGALGPHFSKGGRFGLIEPAYEAIENFFFAPAAVTTAGPHVRDPLDVKRVMSMVIIALVPCIFTGVYFFGLRFIAVTIVSYASGLSVELMFAIFRKESINEGFFVTGILFPLIIPPTLPLWMVSVGVIFGVLVGKELFGGTGRNVFNPAIVSRCFLSLAYPAAMAGNWVAPDSGITGRVFQYVHAGTEGITTATPLGLAKQGLIDQAPLLDMFLGNVGGCVGETSALAILLGGIFLLFTRVANWRTVAGTLAAAAVTAGALRMGNPERFAPVLWHLCAGGLLFGAFYMATDPVTCPITNEGKWVYGILIGTFTILIRNFTGYVEGVMFAILLGNILAPVIDEVFIRMRLRRLKNEG